MSSSAPSLPMSSTSAQVKQPVLSQKLSYNRKAGHPVQKMQSTLKEDTWKAKLDFVTKVYGLTAAMDLEADRQIFSQPTRGPGMGSSYLGLDVVMSPADLISFQDTLNVPGEKADRKMLPIHSAFETRYKI